MPDEQDHLSRVLSDPRVRAKVAHIARGVFWTRAFLSAGVPGAELASHFLHGREDLPERTVMAFGRRVHPTVIGASGRNQPLRMAQWVAVEKQIEELNDPGLKLSGQLGRALDVSDDLVNELKTWLQSSDNGPELELAAHLGPQAFRRLTSTDVSLDLAPYDPSPEISFRLNDF